MDDYGRTKAALTDEPTRACSKIAATEREAARLAPGPDGAGGDGHARRMQTLLEYESKFKCLTEQSLAGVFLIRDGFFTYVNCEMADIFGYAIDEIVDRKRPEDLGFPEEWGPVEDEADKRLPFDAASMQYEFRGKRKDGQAVYLEVHAAPTMDRGDPAVLGLLLDKTDQKKLGTQLIRSERIKAIGTLAGGIAHDFNNLLMGIQGHTSLLLHRLNQADPIYGKLKGIEDLVKSASDLTRKLLGFASGAKYEVRTLDINAIMGRTSEMFGRTRKEIVIKSHYEGHLAAVDADDGQIEQMLLNLYLNASQAMPGGGTLSLTTKNVVLDTKFVRPYSLKPGRYVKISVEDTGEGMDEKTKERIFEPFFTTKKGGRGSGLGLASVYNIVKVHGGLITVHSEKGRGTVFCIYLPASKKTAEHVSDASPGAMPVQKGGETILLVDDEEAVTSVSKDMLEVLGYSVLIARSGQEAIDIYEKRHDAIDLVVLDVVMPDMGGEETLARLRCIKPSVVVTLSSGYSLDRQVTKIMQQGCKSFIQKPFTIGVLSQKLREALDS